MRIWSKNFAVRSLTYRSYGQYIIKDRALPRRFMASMTDEEHQEALFFLGPWLVGLCLDLFLQGIVSSQFSNYYSWYGKTDGIGLKVAVGVLAIATSLKSIQCFAIVWIQLIDNFLDLQTAVNMRFVTWYQIGNPLMVAFIGFYVQMYFCYRLWVVSKLWWVPLPIISLFLFALIAAMVVTHYLAIFDPKLASWLSAHYATVFVADLLLCSSTAYFLLKTKKNVLPQTVGLINALIRLTFQTAAPAVLCALLNLIFVYLHSDETKSVSNAFIQALPKLYAVSMMWTLNSRRSIRVSHGSGKSGSTSNEPSGPRTGYSRSRRTRGPDDIAMGNIQVVTHTETVRVTDMFGDDHQETNGKIGNVVDDEESLKSSVRKN
ncbi:hypothetical protein IW262DRAFT_1410535 [Armillaria fumosa]|nr:hypothetical protein IW262DRAFT_1410535 [Armillaria fumosa]